MWVLLSRLCETVMVQRKVQASIKAAKVPYLWLKRAGKLSIRKRALCKTSRLHD